MSYDQSAPAQGHVVLSDVDAIRNNGNALRSFESSLSTAPPSNPVAGQFWWTTDTKAMYQRKQDNTAWTTALWYETDPPVLTTTFNNHSGANITSAVTVHGIKLGHGGGTGNATAPSGYIDACSLDGKQADYFLGSSHVSASSGVHGATSGVLLHAPTTCPFLVAQASAPTGWTQVVSWNDRVIRVVSGTGGGTSGSWTITGISAEGTHTHTTPNHSHWIADNGTVYTNDSSSTSAVIKTGWNDLRTYSDDAGTTYAYTRAASYTDTSGSGTTTGNSGHAHTFNGSWRPAYLDVIAITKNA